MDWARGLCRIQGINQSLVGRCRTLVLTEFRSWGMSATELLLSSYLDHFPSSPINVTMLINYSPGKQQGTKTVDHCASISSRRSPRLSQTEGADGAEAPRLLHEDW